MVRKPEWIKVRLQGNQNTATVTHLISDLQLNTVCQEANCPNQMECYASKTATFMILGKNCTRNCKFCNVTTKRPESVEATEPDNVAQAIKKLGLKHAVITSVDRDDLPDEGASHFADVVRAVRKINPDTTIELLIPDFHAKHDLLDIVFAEKPDILNHNIEVVAPFFDQICPQSSYQDSLEVLRYAKQQGLVTKSGMMVGFGETPDMVLQTMKDLRAVDCDILTIGQYLQPSRAHMAVTEYVHPDRFDDYQKQGLALGFTSVSSGPFVRSSYHAKMLHDEVKLS